MSAVRTAPPRPAPAAAPFAPRPLRWTATEFNHLGSLGFFEGRRAFLIDGVIWEQGPMNPPHAMGLGLLNEAIRSAFGPNWWVRVQYPLHVDEYNDPLPDLSVVMGQPRDYPSHPATAGLVVEVSDTTLDVDLTIKAERYATAGVLDYWVLDLNARQLHVLRDPAALPAGLGATAYRTHQTLGPGDSITPLAAPSAAVRVADLLP